MSYLLFFKGLLTRDDENPHFKPSKDGAAAAIRKDGTVVTWGVPEYGGDSSAVKDQLGDVECLQATNSSFCALKADGSVVTWGHEKVGGDSSAVQHRCRG